MQTDFDTMGGTYTQVGDYLLPEVEAPAQLSKAVENGTGGKVNTYQLSFAGTCKNCIKK